MNRTIWPLSAVLIAVILAVGGILAARSLRPARLIIDKGPDGVVEGLQMPPGLAVLGQHPKCCVSPHGREVTGRSALEPGTTRGRAVADQQGQVDLRAQLLFQNVPIDARQTEPGCMIIHDPPATLMRASAAYGV